MALGANPASTWIPWNMDVPVAPNGERPGPWNALHQAAYEGHAHLLPRLLGLGLPVDQPDAWGNTPPRWTWPPRIPQPKAWWKPFRKHVG